MIARPGSRVILTSSPWGGPDHFFRQLWQRGMTSPDAQVEAFHWPSTVSPLVDAGLLEQIREREPADYFAREYLAEWTDEAGAYFTEAELTAAAVVEEMVGPEDGHLLGRVVGGVDWGFARDANALAVLAVRPEPDERGRSRLWVPYVVERFATRYDDWIDELVGVGQGFAFQRLVCESNGVGAMPSLVLAKRFAELGLPDVVEAVTTTAALKENAFGWAKVLLSQGRLELPQDPSLLRQLRGLEFERLASGGLRIAVPDRVGHDDVSMAFCLALAGSMGHDAPPAAADVVYDARDLLGDDDVGLDWTTDYGFAAGGGGW